MNSSSINNSQYSDLFALESPWSQVLSKEGTTCFELLVGVWPSRRQSGAVSEMCQNSVSLFCFLIFLVPAAVTNLRITENSTRHLSFSWTPSEGELNSYNIFLYNPDRTLKDRAQVDPQVQSFSFQNLLQGRMYRMVIVTHSGELSNESFIFGRTGKTWTQSVMNSREIVTVLTGFSLIWF